MALLAAERHRRMTGKGQKIVLPLQDMALAATSALGYIGASQSRMENAITTLKTTVQNYSAAESTIRDVDMADEMVNFSKNNILAQAGTAILAQANQAGQGILKLLG